LKVLVAGAYGFGNLGDEALLAVLLERLRSIHASVKVFSFSPRETYAMHKSQAISYLSLHRVLYAIMTTDVLLIGAGGVFDTRIAGQTRRAMAWLYIACGYLALVMRRKLWLEGISILTPDPLTYALLCCMLRHADRVSVRDECSRRILSRLSIDVNVVGDLSLALEPANKESADLLLESVGVNKRLFKVGLALRSTGDSKIDQKLAVLVKDLASWASRHSAQLLLIAFSHNRWSRFEDDVSFLRDLRTAAGHQDVVTMFAGRVHPSVMEAVVGRMNFLVGMRLHSVIMAHRMSVPMLALAYHPKIKAFADSVRAKVVELNKLDSALVKSMVESVNLRFH